MSSLSAALNSSGLDINDVAFWDRVAAHFREKLGRMVCSPSNYLGIPAI
jgi:hypothetical protein